MKWDLKNENGEQLPPRKFGNKTQLDFVNETINAFDKGHRIVLLEGACGIGKSAIAMNIIAHYGKGIITVPLINLQKQYFDNYNKKMSVHNQNIGFIMGRNNFKCVYGYNEKNRLCTKKLELDETRLEVAGQCPGYSPRLPLSDNLLQDYKRYPYKTGDNIMMALYMSKNPCRYYKQFISYNNADIIILNDIMWLIETSMNRKPIVDIEVFDEADHFLDKLSTEIVITEKILTNLPTYGLESLKQIKEDILYEFRKIRYPYKRIDIRRFLNGYIQYLYKFKFGDEVPTDYNLATKFDNLIHFIKYWDKVFLDTTFGKNKLEEIKLGLAYPDIILKSLLDNSANKILMMTGTPQNIKVLKELYGIEPYIIKTNTKVNGNVEFCKTRTIKITNGTWNNHNTQSKYHILMNNIIIKASKKNEKILIQTMAKKYINFISGDKILFDGYNKCGKNSIELNNWIENTDKNILISTRVSRGVDLKDDLCRHIIIAKCPFPYFMSPNIQSLKSRFDNTMFNIIYNDITRRILLQQLSRASRHDKDWVKIWTPDEKAMEMILDMKDMFDNFTVKDIY